MYHVATCTPKFAKRATSIKVTASTTIYSVGIFSDTFNPVAGMDPVREGHIVVACVVVAELIDDVVDDARAM